MPLLYQPATVITELSCPPYHGQGWESDLEEVSARGPRGRAVGETSNDQTGRKKKLSSHKSETLSPP